MLTVEDIRTAPNKKTLIEYAKIYGITNYSRISRGELENKLIEAIEQPQEETKQETPKEFFNRVSQIVDESELKVECEKLLEDLSTENLQPKSKSNKLRPYARLFKELTPSNSGLPTEMFFAFTAKGKSTAIDRHKFFKFTGLADIDWLEVEEDIRDRKAKRVGKDRPKDELADALSEESKIFSLDKYIATMSILLNSSDPWENAVGLIAASGRRPFEIMIGANFETVENSPQYLTYSEYAVQVNGLAKKRDNNPTTIVPLLIPTPEFLTVLEKFRSNSEIEKVKQEYDLLIEYGTHETDAAKKIEDKFGKKIRDITGDYFNFIPKIDDGHNRKNILLRACTMKILTMRDKPRVTARARIHYAGVIAGHIIPIFKQNGSVEFNGKASASTLNYDDYEPDVTAIPLLENIVNSEIKDTQNMAKIAELNAQIETLKAELASKDEAINVQLESLKTELADKDETIKVLRAKLNARESKENLPDVTDMNTSMLLTTRKKGSSDEKLNRCYQALTAYNNNVAE